MTGRKAFLTIWIGQLISVVGTRLSTFALGIWALETTGSTTRYAIIFICMAVPALLLSPVAGALVDRWDRRRVMIVSDAVAASTVLVLALLHMTGRLELHHVYIAAAVQAVVSAFQLPAYFASIPLLMPNEQLVRANAMVQTAFATAQIAGPALAGALVATIGLRGVLLTDFVSFAAAMIALSFVSIPRPAAAPEQQALLREAGEGWRFIRERRGLLALLGLFGFTNFLFGVLSILITPMVLGFTNAAALGAQMSAGGCGLFAGGLLMSAWGGPKRRIHAVLGAMIVAGIFLAAHGLRPSFWLVASMGFCFFFTIPVMNASQDAIWQTRVPESMQGRCFAFQRLLSEAAMPIGYCIAGPLAERLFEPMLAPRGTLAASIGSVIGTGPGRGIALLFIIAGVAMSLAGIAGYAITPLRRVEDADEAAAEIDSMSALPIPEAAS